MPENITPGVFIEETPGGPKPIEGAATDIAAFIGRAARGPTNVPTAITSFAEFERVFGGLWQSSLMSFAVRDFFLNGGVRALIVRLYHAKKPEKPSQLPRRLAYLSVGGMNFAAASEGSWGANLRLEIDCEFRLPAIAKERGVATTDLFNLTIRDTTANGQTEKFHGLTVKDTPWRIDRVLEQNSQLLRFRGHPAPDCPLIPSTDAITVLENAYAHAQEVLDQRRKSNPLASAAAETKAVERSKAALDTALSAAAAAVSDGLPLVPTDFFPPSGESEHRGLYTLDQVDLFNILCIPPYREPSDPTDFDPEVMAHAAAYCERRRAMLIVDSPKDWKTAQDAKPRFSTLAHQNPSLISPNAAIYFPRLRYANPLRANAIESFPACGAVAGVWARTDNTRGVWKAPAGTEATLIGLAPSSGTSGGSGGSGGSGAGAGSATTPFTADITDAGNADLSHLGVNCLRVIPATGSLATPTPVIWGARTLRGADAFADVFKYIPVRRLAIFIEESLHRGLQWVTFEPATDATQAAIRSAANGFLHGLFTRSAFQGAKPEEAYSVRCDATTTTPLDIEDGITNLLVGFAPLKPAEFVILRIRLSSAR